MRTYGKSSLSQQRANRALAVVVLVLLASVAFAQTPALDAFDAMGFQKNRNYFSPEPYEHYDTVSGNVLLTFTDLTLPGNAGRSLQFQPHTTTSAQVVRKAVSCRDGVSDSPEW